jgi:hypothetical protein
MSPEHPKILFVHIPRTGGMTFGEILRTLYDGHGICSFYGDETGSVANDKIHRFVSRDAAEKNRFAVLKGHVVFGFDPSLTGFQPVTLLRKPLERLVSYYFYALRNRHHYLHAFLMQRKLRLEPFLVSELSIELDNYQVRAVSGAAFSTSRERVNRDHLELAKRNLRERFAAFGLSESFDRSMLEFARRFGWCLPPFGRENRGEYAGQPELSAEGLAHVTRRNQFDIELYQYAEELFANRIEQRVR